MVHCQLCQELHPYLVISLLTGTDQGKKWVLLLHIQLSNQTCLLRCQVFLDQILQMYVNGQGRRETLHRCQWMSKAVISQNILAVIWEKLPVMPIVFNTSMWHHWHIWIKLFFEQKHEKCCYSLTQRYIDWDSQHRIVYFNIHWAIWVEVGWFKSVVI